MKKRFGDHPALILILLVGIVVSTFYSSQEADTRSSLRELDARIELEFDSAKSSVAYHLREDVSSASLSEAISQLRMASLYGYYLDGRFGGDPQWLLLAEPLREIGDPAVLAHLSRDDREAIAQFLDEHGYRNDPPITETDLVPLIGPLEGAVSKYQSE